MAIKLWKHFRPEIKIYIKLIYTKTPEVLAPLRKLYEDSILAGEVKNTNSNNLLHNFLTD